MARELEGLKSEALRSALDAALAGEFGRLEELLARHGGMPSPRPNLKLAQAFGNELAGLDAPAGARTLGSNAALAPLLERLASEDAAPDDARVFLPIAAAHGWAGRIRAGRDVELAWAALEQLCADERGPVRVGTLDALAGLAARPGGADALVERAAGWLEASSDAGARELRFGAAALVIEVLGDARALAVVRDAEQLLAYLSQVIETIAAAPRAAERSAARRRALTSLAGALPALVSALRSGGRGSAWLAAECERAAQPDVRRVLSDCIVKLQAQGGDVAALRRALEQSAKPARDPTLRRKGTGRGKQTRRTR